MLTVEVEECLTGPVPDVHVLVLSPQTVPDAVPFSPVEVERPVEFFPSKILRTMGFVCGDVHVATLAGLLTVEGDGHGS